MNWQDVETEVEALSKKITLKPNIIVAVVRGGLIPARLLVRKLSVKDMYCLSVRKQGDKRILLSHIVEDISGKTVLLVEDTLETGANLKICKQYLESLGAKVNTAALYVRSGAQIMPDYYLETRKQLPSFPWEEPR